MCGIFQVSPLSIFYVINELFRLPPSSPLQPLIPPHQCIPQWQQSHNANQTHRRSYIGREPNGISCELSPRRKQGLSTGRKPPIRQRCSSGRTTGILLIGRSTRHALNPEKRLDSAKLAGAFSWPDTWRDYGRPFLHYYNNRPEALASPESTTGCQSSVFNSLHCRLINIDPMGIETN